MSKRWKKIKCVDKFPPSLVKSLPPSGVEVLLAISGKVVRGTYWEDGKYFTTSDEYDEHYEINEVAGWQDLPRLPEWGGKCPTK